MTFPERSLDIDVIFDLMIHDLDLLLTVAVPTVSHLDVAVPFLESGIATLVEKPIASSVSDADRLIAAAQRGGAVLATGHTERFNPAVAKALPLINEPRFIEIHRLGTFPERSLDLG